MYKMQLTLTDKTIEDVQNSISSNLVIIASIHTRYHDENRLWHIHANDNDLQQLYVEMYGRPYLYQIHGAPTLNDTFLKILDSFYQDKDIRNCEYSVTYITRFEEEDECAMLDITFTQIFQIYGVSPNILLDVH